MVYLVSALYQGFGAVPFWGGSGSWEDKKNFFTTVNKISKPTCNTCIYSYYFRKDIKNLCTVKCKQFAWLVKLKLKLEPVPELGQCDGSGSKWSLMLTGIQIRTIMYADGKYYMHYMQHTFNVDETENYYLNTDFALYTKLLIEAILLKFRYVV